MGDVLKQVGLRNHFYRDSYRVVLAAFLLSVLVNIALAGLSFYQFTHRPHPAYVATSADGAILPLQPLNQPYLSKEQLLQWTRQAILASFNYDYIKYRDQLSEASAYYSASGWNGLTNRLRDSGELQMVIRDKAIVQAKPTNVPTAIGQPSILGGRRVWLLHMPVMVQYIAGTSTTTRNRDVTVTVQRESILKYPDGVSIRAIVVQDAQGSAGPVGSG